MPIIAKETGGGPKELAPVDLHNAVCAFVEDLGIQPGFQGAAPKHKAVVIWELEEKMSDGRPFMLSKKYTLSLHEKSTLRHDLESWRGKPFTTEELAGFDIERLVGTQCRLNVIHQPKADGSLRAVVQSVIKPAPGVKLERVATDVPTWVNEERKKAITSPEGPRNDAPPPGEDDSLPF